MSWVEVDGAAWRWMEVDGAGWSWVEVDAQFSNAVLKVVLHTGLNVYRERAQEVLGL